MIRFMRAALRGIKAEVQYPGGWSPIHGVTSGFGGGGAVRSSAGTLVSQDTIMGLSAAFACTTRNAQLISCLPGTIVEKQQDGSDQQVDDDLLDILTVKPNPNQTAPEYWEGKIAHMLTRGNSYSEKLMIGNRLVGLRPLLNTVPKPRDDGQFNYHVTDRGKTEVLPPEKVFHLRGFGGGDGLGVSVIRYGVTSFGAALAADEVASSVFRNGMHAGGVFTIPPEVDLSGEQRAQLQETLEKYAGSKNAGRSIALEHGITWSATAITPEDAQLLETRRFNVEDICRWFGTPPIIIGHAAEGQTMWGTGVEAIMQSWLITGINPLLRRIEARIRADLMPKASRRARKFEFNREAVLQMDSGAKADFLTRLTLSGIMSRNESRRKLNLTTRGGAADDLFAQIATAPIDLIGKENP